MPGKAGAVERASVMEREARKRIVTNEFDSLSCRGPKRFRDESRCSRADFHSAARRGPQIQLAACLLADQLRLRVVSVRRHGAV